MNWFVTDAGNCEPLELPHLNLRQPYRLYRLLSDIEDIVEAYDGDRDRLHHIVPRVRQFLLDAQWLEAFYVPPDPQKGWSVAKLYDEPDYPFTVQLVAWQPGASSPIHNHAAWGVVAMLYGEERNQFWQRKGDSVTKTGDRSFSDGDIITFSEDAIHCVEALGDEPTVSLNLYGRTDYSRRFEFDAIAQTAKRF